MEIRPEKVTGGQSGLGCIFLSPFLHVVLESLQNTYLMDIHELPSDEDLMHRVQRDDVEAYRELYNRYKKRMFAYILQIVRDQEVAKDVFQTVFSTVFANRDQFTYGTFRAWLFTIAKRTAMRAWTEEAPSRAAAGMDEAYDPIDEDDKTGHDVILSDALRTAIEKLTPEFQEALQLRYYEDLSFEEISERMNTTLSLAKVRVTRAKQALRKLMIPIAYEVTS
ncbi:MAG: RNA polymerase sigma factor [Ignavibacteria bacterium]|nr:RNA polymerase sigma factor [Ignavibacteria bacterium]